MGALFEMPSSTKTTTHAKSERAPIAKMAFVLLFEQHAALMVLLDAWSKLNYKQASAAGLARSQLGLLE